MRTLVLLAAGVGSRLRPDTDRLPKTLLPVGGQTILDHLRAAFGAWPDRVVVVTGHERGKLEAHVATWAPPPELCHNARFDETNSLYSLHVACEAWRDADEVVVTNTDVLVTEDAVRGLVEAPGDIVLGLDRREVDDEDMKILLDDEGTVARVSKRIPSDRAAGEFTGIAIARNDGVRTLREIVDHSVRDPVMKATAWYDLALDALAVSGVQLHCHTLPAEHYAEVDTHEDLREARRRFGS